MKVKYLYSACIEIDCDGFRILTDPWFSQGAYDGSWFHYHKIDPFEHIDKPDIIYISHIHPDHYDPIFLKKIIEKYGDIPIIIPDLDQNYLLFKGKSDGLNLIPTRHLENPKVEIHIEENNTGSMSDIDSALLVHDKKNNKTLLNLNDCIFNQNHVDTINNIISIKNYSIDLLALGYTGAGPYPQTYFDPINQLELLNKEANKKRLSFFDRYKKYTETFVAEYNLPFAGEYLLGGKLSELNHYRGVSDAIEVKDIDEKAIILEVGGVVNLIDKKIDGERFTPYNEEYINERISEISINKMDYESEINIQMEKINFLRLLKNAAFKANLKSEIGFNYNFIFSIQDSDGIVKKRFGLETESSKISIFNPDEEIILKEYSEIIIDYRYLYGLLTTIYHWNNAEVGSQFRTIRMPFNNYNASVQDYLNFFTVA